MAREDMPPRLDNYGWVKRHVGSLMELGSKCEKVQPHVANEFGAWTALKLCALKNYVDIYTRILDDDRLKKRLHFEGRAYLDVFAGSGLNLIGDHRTPVAGSTPIAANFHYRDRPFNKYYALEINPDYCAALQARMSMFASRDSYCVIEGDADKNLGKVLDELEERKLHYLAFVDY